MAETAQEKIKQQQEFYKIYKKEVLPSLLAWETFRQRKRRFFIILKWVLVLIVGVLSVLNILYIAKFQNGQGELFIPFFIIAALIIYTFWYKGEEYKFIKNLKQENLAKLIKPFGDIHWCGVRETLFPVDNSKVIPDFILEKSGLFINRIDRRKTDDEFCGNYENISYRISETELMQRYKDSKGRTHYSTFFKGLFISIDSNKEIKSHTVVRTKNFSAVSNNYTTRIFTIIGICLIIGALALLPSNLNNISAVLSMLFIGTVFALAEKLSPKTKKFENVNLEDSEFNKKFEVIAKDQVESRYLLTPSFMERMLNLKNAFNSKDFAFAFFDGQLLIAIPTTENLFEIGNFKTPLDDINIMKKLSSQMTSIFDIIDQLKLTQDIGI